MACRLGEVQFGLRFLIYNRDFTSCDLGPLDGFSVSVLEIVSVDNHCLSFVAVDFSRVGEFAEIIRSA